MRGGLATIAMITQAPSTRGCDFIRNNLNLQTLLSTNDGEFHGATDGLLGEGLVDVIRTGYPMRIDGHDDIPFPDTPARGRAPSRYRRHLYTELRLKPIIPHQTSCKRTLLANNPQVSAPHSSDRE